MSGLLVDQFQGWYDPAKLAAFQAGVTPDANFGGRQLVGDDGWLQALNSLSGIRTLSESYTQSAGTYMTGSGENMGETYLDAIFQAGEYRGPNNQLFWGVETPSGQDPNGTYIQWSDNSGGGFENPTGSKRDRVQPIYLLGADGTATPVGAGTNYRQSAWTDYGRDLAILATSMVAAFVGGTALQGLQAGASATTAATVAATEGATALTLEGAAAQGFGTSLGMEGFGAGLGSGLTEVGIVDSLSFLGGYGTVASTPAVLTFAGQGISLASSSLSLWDTVKTAAEKLVPSSSSATAAPAKSTLVDAAVGAGSWFPSAGQVLNGVGAAAGLVGTVAGAAGAVEQLVNGNKPPSSSSSSSSAPMRGQAGGGASNASTWLLILAGAAGVYYVSRK